MSGTIDHPRRRFLGAAAVALAAGELVMGGGGNVWAASGEAGIEAEPSIRAHRLRSIR